MRKTTVPPRKSNVRQRSVCPRLCERTKPADRSKGALPLSGAVIFMRGPEISLNTLLHSFAWEPANVSPQESSTEMVALWIFRSIFKHTNPLTHANIFFPKIMLNLSHIFVWFCQAPLSLFLLILCISDSHKHARTHTRFTRTLKKKGKVRNAVLGGSNT